MAAPTAHAVHIIQNKSTVHIGDTTRIDKTSKKDIKTNSFAIAGLVASSVGLLCLFLFPPAAFLLMTGGVVFSALSFKQIKKRNEKGLGLATTGLIIGGAGIVLTILAIALLFTILSGWN